MIRRQIQNRGGVKSSSPETITERGGLPGETDEPSEIAAPEETSVTEPPAETEETTAPETETTSETEETENSDIELLSLFDDSTITQDDELPTTSGTYTLGGDITVSGWTIPENVSIDLDLGGHNIDAAGGQINVSGGAVLNISGSGTIIRTGLGNMTCIKVNSGGTVNLNDNVEITFSGTDFDYAINNNGGTVTLNNNVNINNLGAHGCSINNTDGATLTINGCNIGSQGNYNIIDINSSTVFINGGKINSKLGNCIKVYI